MKIWKYSGILLIITGILHTLIALWLGKEALIGMIRDGFVNSVGSDISREFAFWFFICGLAFIFLGHVLHYYIKKEQKPAPLFVAYYLLAISAVVCLIEPESGGWLFIPQALIIIFAKRKRQSNT
jgi:phosphoglycerol transferase MdoB-like AlkP superfamily enzyme